MVKRMEFLIGLLRINGDPTGEIKDFTNLLEVKKDVVSILM